jgi:hypothetical protein
MKTKNFERKLVFNKKTIADLDNIAMEKAHGGVRSVDICYTDRTRCATMECCETDLKIC